MFRLILTYLKRPLFLSCLLLTFASLVISLIAYMDTSWWKTWHDATGAIVRNSFITGSILAALSAFTQSLEHDDPEHLASGVARQAMLARIVSFLLISTIALASAAIFASICVTFWEPQAVGFLWWDFLIHMFLTQALAIMWGTILGLFSHSFWFTTPLALISFFLISTTTADGHGSTLNQLLIYPYDVINTHKLITLAILTLALFIFAWAFNTYRLLGSHLPRKAPFIIAVASAGLVCASTVFSFSQPILVTREKPENPLCVGEGQRLCMWPEYTPYREEFEAMMARISTLPDFYTIAPVTYEQVGIGDPDSPHLVYMVEGSLWALSPTIAGQIQADSHPFCNLRTHQDSQDHKRLEELNGQEYTWLNAYLVGSTKVSSSLIPPWVRAEDMNEVLARSLQDQRAWLSSLRAEREAIEKRYGCEN